MVDKNTDINRRDFIKVVSTAGAGLVIAVHLPCYSKLRAATFESPLLFKPNAWVTVTPDNGVTIAVVKSEMGQGVLTALPMILAEEMDLDWAQIKIVQPPVNEKKYGKFGTGGSTSVKSSWKKLRKAGAVAKAMLLEAGAKKWSVPVTDCYAEKGFILHRNTGKKISYGNLAGRAAKLDIPRKVDLKKDKNFSVIGKSILRTDTPQKVNGTAQFSMDIDLPGMVIASIVRCPVFGGTLNTMSTTKAKQINGVVEVFEMETGIAVVGTSTWAVLQGRKALEITWNGGKNEDLTSQSISTFFKKRGGKSGSVGRKDGNTKRALKNAEKVLESAYEVPFQAHATMEPMNCVVDVQPNQCKIWAPTQSGHSAQKKAAKITGLPMDKIEVNVTFLGGGFGRRSFNDFIEDGVRVSKHLGKPVKLVWTREDDMRHDYYRPASRHILKGGLNKNGDTIAWTHRIVAQSILFGQILNIPIPFKDKLDIPSFEGAKNVAYDIPNIRVEYTSVELNIPVGWWRSVYDSQNAFANECFIDELAFEAGKDPVKYRLNLLKNSPRHRAVLKLAAEKSGWKNPRAKGRFLGVSCHESFGTYIAQTANVSIDSEGTITVHRIDCAVDCGQVVNPSIVEAQMESSIVYGLSATIKGEITIEKGKVTQSNFHDFNVLRMDEMPEIKVHIIKSTEHPGGVGEPGLPPVAPAVANAVFAATGKRIRKLPIKAEDLQS